MLNLRTEVTFKKQKCLFQTQFWFTDKKGYGTNKSDFLWTEVTFGRQKCLLMYRSDFLSPKNRSVFFDDFSVQKCHFPYILSCSLRGPATQPLHNEERSPEFCLRGSLTPMISILIYFEASFIVKTAMIHETGSWRISRLQGRSRFAT